MKLLKSLTALALSFTMLFTSITSLTLSAADDIRSIKLMPLGDSITDGFSTTGGYRVPLCNALEQAGLSSYVDMIGPNWTGACYDGQHAGYSGYSIDNIEQSDSISGSRTGLSSFIDWLLDAYPPEAVMLQIGTNDILSNYDLDNIGARLESLVDTVLSYLPSDGMLFLATITCMDANNTLYINADYFTPDSMDACVNAYNAEIRAIVARKQAAGETRITLADTTSVITKADLYDGVHPSDSGYDKLGEFWYEQISAFITGSDVDPPQPVKGDADSDGDCDAYDALLVKKHLLATAVLSEPGAASCDFDGDAVVTTLDLAALRRVLIS